MTATVHRLTYTAVCRLDALIAERGAAALVHGVQVAVFRLHDGRVRAIGNRDPVCGAHVLSRGIVGSRGDAPVVSSPMYKQAFDLRTGRCLDDDSVSVPAYDVAVEDGRVRVGSVSIGSAREST